MTEQLQALLQPGAGTLPAGRIGDRRTLEPDAAEDGQPRIERQQQPPRTGPGRQRRHDGGQQQQRGIAEDLPDGQVTRHARLGNAGGQQRIDGHLDGRIADAQQAETDKVPHRSASCPGRIGDRQSDDGEGIARQRRSLASDAVHHRGDRQRQHQEPQEDHCRQEADQLLPVGRQFSGDTSRNGGYHVTEPHDEKSRQNGTEQPFVHLVRTHRLESSLLFNFSKLRFLAKSKRSAPIFRCFHRNMRDATDAPKPEREPDSGGTGTGREGRRRSVLRKIFGSGSCPYPDFSYLCIFDKNATRCFCSHT